MDKSTNLIERYLQEVGRRLPAAKRSDILPELRSSLIDDLETRTDGQPQEKDAEALLREWGAPAQVAASFYPGGQYLVGPTLYPLFRLVLRIVFGAVIGAQLLAVLIAFLFSPESVSVLDSFWQIINSLPAALGFVVIAFYFLQRQNVNPEMEEDTFDPQKLPQLSEEQPVSLSGTVFSIVFAVIILVLLSRFAAGGGFSMGGAGGVFNNPVIDRYFFWIALSMSASILMDVFMLWRRRWDSSSRFLKFGVNLYSLAVLFLLVQGHNAWLADAGFPGLFDSLSRFPDAIATGAQVIGMLAFRLALTVAFIVTAVETIIYAFRLGRDLFGPRPAANSQKL